MQPFVFDPFVPVAVEELGEDAGLYRVLFHLLFPLLVQGVAFLKRLIGILRPDGRDEGEVLPVGRPDAGIRASRNVHDLPGLAAIDVDNPELAIAGAVRFEQDALAIRTPAWVSVLLAGGRVRQLSRLAFLRRR